jgi:tetratricopeptide (TPR) repeat protein
MLDKINSGAKKQALIICIVLAVVTIVVYWQVNKFDFVNFDDNIYITDNTHLQSGITLAGIHWAFSTKHADLWNPLVWLSFMFDYQLFGLNAGGYHLTNLILHILSTLLLFRLFNHMTGEIWKSSFVAALFALHPLHVESVAWVSERKDVLSAFFWMLTLYLYVRYAGKPDMKRYLLVLFTFILALISKPMVVTLPVIMILLDYWPLGRFHFRETENKLKGITFGKDHLLLVLEKIPFMILSIAIIIITISGPDNPGKIQYLLRFRVSNAFVSFITYLEKAFWPHDMAVFYNFPTQIPVWQVAGASLLIITVTIFVFITAKRFPSLFVGWFWYAITIAPVIGVIQLSNHPMADRYYYLPSIGIAVMLAWGVPVFIKNEKIRKKILFPAGITFLAMLSVLTWQQCSYWENTVSLFNHALQVTKNNYLAHNNLGVTLLNEGKIAEAICHYNKSINIKPDYINAYINLGNAYTKLGEHQKAFENFNKAITINPNYLNNFNAYNKRGIAYAQQGKYTYAINDFNKAISLKSDYADAYYNRGVTYANMGQYQQAIDNYNESIILQPDYPFAYYNRGVAYTNKGQYQRAVDDYNKAIQLKPDYADAYYNRGISQYIMGRYQPAIEDFSQTIHLKEDDANAYNSRAIVYLNQGNKKLGCHDAQKACTMKVCEALKIAKDKDLCR